MPKTATIETPCYLIDKQSLLGNLEIIRHVRQESGAKALLALKCFAAWSVFDLMSEYLDGTTSSSLFETKLGRSKFGGETHAYSVAYADREIDEVSANADTVIFNSVAQVQRFAGRIGDLPCGLRLNPGISHSDFPLADPARRFSRLGESDPDAAAAVIDRLSGFMVHNNCDNADFAAFDTMLGAVEERFGALFRQVDWVSLGGGIDFTGGNYPLDAFCTRLKAFAERYGVQVYLEPGEAAVSGSATLEVTVLDTPVNEKALAIVDSSIEAHMLDLLVYREDARLDPDAGEYVYTVCGKSCLAGDIFGEFRFDHPLRVGERLSFRDAAGYTMVKKNWFNGLAMPSIAVRQLDGSIDVVRTFSFDDYVSSLS